MIGDMKCIADFRRSEEIMDICAEEIIGIVVYWSLLFREIMGEACPV